MIWLYDSRNRSQGKRLLHILPSTREGKLRAWAIVLDAEVPNEIPDYQSLADMDAAHPTECGLLNDYWSEYGWCLTQVDNETAIPSDAEEVQWQPTTTPSTAK